MRYLQPSAHIFKWPNKATTIGCQLRQRNVKHPLTSASKGEKKKKDPDVLNDGEVKVEVRRGRVRR